MVHPEYMTQSPESLASQLDSTEEVLRISAFGRARTCHKNVASNASGKQEAG